MTALPAAVCQQMESSAYYSQIESVNLEYPGAIFSLWKIAIFMNLILHKIPMWRSSS